MNQNNRNRHEDVSHSPSRDIRYFLFRAALLGGSAFALVVLFSYIFTKRPLVNTLTMIGLILFCGLLYLMSYNPRQYTLARIFLYLVVGFVFVPFGYIMSPGSQGSMPYHIVMIIFLFTILAVKTWEYIFPIAVIIVQYILLNLELNHPELFIPFVSEEQRIFDLGVNYTMVALFIVAVMIFVMRRYHKYSMMLLDRSVTDMLTGLYNKRYLEENAEYELNRCQRKGDNLSLMFIDLNNFKNINDTLGHGEGDQVLKDVADIIRKNTRNYDVCARYGGDEFLILLPSTSKEQAREQIKRLDEAFTAYSEHYREQGFSVSFGIADSDDGDFDTLMELADKRLYEDKRIRKNI